jgi:hypothetical protein
VDFTEQYELASNAISTGDIDLLAKLLTNPDTVTINEQRTVAQKLGLKGGFLSAAVNTVSDPLVWMAAFMSRKFPTLAWLKGTIPHRFIGTSAQFSGLSLAVTPAESMFRGTNLAKLNSLAQHRMATVLETARKRIFDPISARPRWKEEMPIVSRILEGGNPHNGTQELHQLAAKIRGGMEDMWGFLGKTQRIEGGMNDGTLARARPFTAAEAPKHLRDYLPHIPLQGNDSTFTVSAREAMEKLGGNHNRTIRDMLKMKGEGLDTVWSMTKQDTLRSEFNRWQQWVGSVGSQVYNPHLFKRVRHGLQLNSPKGQEFFYTDLNLVLQKYATSVARTYALNAPLSARERVMTAIPQEGGGFRMPTSEPVMVQIINQGLRTAGVDIRERKFPGSSRVQHHVVPGTGSSPMLKALNSYVKSVRGSSSDDEQLWAPLFNRVYSKIEGMRQAIGGKAVNDMTDAVSTVQNSNDYRRISNGITNYFYATTLGLNPISAVKNLLQPTITTAPAIGIGPTLAGMKEFAPKVQRFFSDTAHQMRTLPAHSKGIRRFIDSANKSFQKHFPELVDQRLDIDPRLFDINDNELRQMLGPTGKFKTYDDAVKLIMAPFTGSEIANRATTFYGTRHAIRNAIRTGEYPLPKMPDGKAITKLQLDEIINFEAANVVNATQFRPGPGQRTVLQAAMPPPLRQFTTFPIRLLNFFSESTVRGAMSQAQLQDASLMEKVTTLGGRNLGTLARTFLFGKIAHTGMRDVLGVDLSDAMGLGAAFPFVPNDQPFAPLPMPPLPSAIFGTMSAFSSRDIKKLHPLELPGGVTIPLPKTLFPGGIAASRLSRALNQWRPDIGGFVDDDERLMFKGDTPDLILQMLGIPLDKMSRERRDMERLHANRRVVRDFGRKFRLAATNYDFKGMENIRKDYAEVFPDMPQLSVSNRDLDLFRSARRKTRVQRMLGTLPGAFRTVERHIYDVDPDLIEPTEMKPLLGG